MLAASTTKAPNANRPATAPSQSAPAASAAIPQPQSVQGNGTPLATTTAAGNQTQPGAGANQIPAQQQSFVQGATVMRDLTKEASNEAKQASVSRRQLEQAAALPAPSN